MRLLLSLAHQQLSSCSSMSFFFDKAKQCPLAIWFLLVANECDACRFEMVDIGIVTEILLGTICSNLRCHRVTQSAGEH